jgi:hypothetical protein
MTADAAHDSGGVLVKTGATCRLFFRDFLQVLIACRLYISHYLKMIKVSRWFKNGGIARPIARGAVERK